MNFLTPHEHSLLKVQHRLEGDGRVRDRLKAILLFDKGWSPWQIAEALMIDESTVYRHIKEFEDTKKLKPENGGSASKLEADQTDELIKHLESHVYFYAKDICAYIKDRYQISYTIPGITSWLQAQGFSYKQPKGTPHKADPMKQAAFIKAYENLLKTTCEDEPIEFGDGVVEYRASITASPASKNPSCDFHRNGLKPS